MTQNEIQQYKTAVALDALDADKVAQNPSLRDSVTIGMIESARL